MEFPRIYPKTPIFNHLYGSLSGRGELTSEYSVTWVRVRVKVRVGVRVRVPVRVRVRVRVRVGVRVGVRLDNIG